MKFNNKKRALAHKSIYQTILFILVAIFLFIISTEFLFKDYEMAKYGLIVFIVLLLIYIFRGNEYFEYDSTGMVVSIKNDSIIKEEFRPEQLVAVEFPKEKLDHYKIQNYLIHKRLNIYLKSSHHNALVKNSFNITHLSPRRIHALKQSLHKIISENHAKV